MTPTPPAAPSGWSGWAGGAEGLLLTPPSCRFSIDRRSDPERLFSIGVHSGAIATAQPLDRETVAVHNLTVVATESRESDL